MVKFHIFCSFGEHQPVYSSEVLTWIPLPAILPSAVHLSYIFIPAREKETDYHEKSFELFMKSEHLPELLFGIPHCIFLFDYPTKQRPFKLSSFKLCYDECPVWTYLPQFASAKTGPPAIICGPRP